MHLLAEYIQGRRLCTQLLIGLVDRAVSGKLVLVDWAARRPEFLFELLDAYVAFRILCDWLRIGK